jgi:hypothetical protein
VLKAVTAVDKTEFQHFIIIIEDTLFGALKTGAYARHLYASHAKAPLNTHGLEIRFAFFRLTVLDLVKVYSSAKRKNTFKYSLPLLLSKMELGKDFEPFALPTERLAFYMKTIEGLQPKIGPFIALRDTFIAHTDGLAGYAPGPHFFQTVDELTNLGFDIANECRQKVLKIEPRHHKFHIDFSSFPSFQ